MRVLLVFLFVAIATAGSARSQDLSPVFYLSEYKIDWNRIDSATTLISKYEIPWHEFIASKVDGYERWYFTHDTGDEPNIFIVTRYPDWDYISGDEIDVSALMEEYKSAGHITDADLERRRALFDYALEGHTHTDRIVRQIVAEDQAH